jgi:hypothetical protein
MLYPDSERRIKIATEILQIFKSRGYIATAKEGEIIVTILRESVLPPDLASIFNTIINVFAEEFKNSLEEGKNYRSQVFDEIEKIINGAVDRTFPQIFGAYSEIDPIFTNILNGRNTIGDIADEITTFAKSNRKIMFLLCCYSYLIMVEGVFDEICRALYFFSKLTKTHTPKGSEILQKSVKQIMKDFTVVPLFLQNWEEKKNIRNAIAHATTYFDAEKDEVRFIDKQAGYDKTKSLNDFLLIVLEFDDIAESFSILLCLLEMLKLVTLKNLKYER